MPQPSDNQAEQQRIVRAIASIGPVLPGTLLERSMRCRSAGCHCHSDPPQLHGPYFFWTRKVAGKTVSQVLSAEQAAEYRAWIENEHKLRDLVHELEQLGLDAVASDQRSPRRRLGGRSVAN